MLRQKVTGPNPHACQKHYAENKGGGINPGCQQSEVEWLRRGKVR